jgi:hypothetical protein
MSFFQKKGYFSPKYLYTAIFRKKGRFDESTRRQNHPNHPYQRFTILGKTKKNIFKKIFIGFIKSEKSLVWMVWMVMFIPP